jgi:hypothetical protein
MSQAMKIEARFYETYEMCDVVDRILRDPSNHMVQLEGFHCDGAWTDLVTPFQKYSAFHRFVEFVVRVVHAEQFEAIDLQANQRIFQNFRDIPPALADLQPSKLPIEFAFDHYGIEYQSFAEHLENSGSNFLAASDDDLYHFMQDTWLTEPYDRLLSHTVREVFHVLFQNRSLLLSYNDYVASVIRHAAHDGIEYPLSNLFTGKGTLKRVRPPMWARRAVFFRDRGRCVLCERDLSGLLNIDNVENYDHIVALTQYGLNDISNLQLLCVECNQRLKSGGASRTSPIYQSWYSYD